MPTPSLTPPSLGCDAQSPTDYTGQWLVLTVLPKHTKSAAFRLNEAGIGYYLPLYEVMALDSQGKKRNKVLALYPGYLFANVRDDDERYAACRARGVYGHIDVPNQMRFAHEMKQIHGVASVFDPNAAIREGTVVRVTSGSLMGHEGPVVQRLKSGRIRIYLHILGEYRDVDIEPSRLEAVA